MHDFVFHGVGISARSSICIFCRYQISVFGAFEPLDVLFCAVLSGRRPAGDNGQGGEGKPSI